MDYSSLEEVRVDSPVQVNKGDIIEIGGLSLVIVSVPMTPAQEALLHCLDYLPSIVLKMPGTLFFKMCEHLTVLRHKSLTRSTEAEPALQYETQVQMDGGNLWMGLPTVGHPLAKDDFVQVSVTKTKEEFVPKVGEYYKIAHRTYRIEQVDSMRKMVTVVLCTEGDNYPLFAYENSFTWELLENGATKLNIVDL